jgi:vacuolar-type H+-ATPase subunit I/STV1
MNYSQLSLKELIHYGELDATTELERALVAALAEAQGLEADYATLEDEHAAKLRTVERRLDAIKEAIQDLEDELP